MSEGGTRPGQLEADLVAKAAGASGPAMAIIDAWGGYWQCATPSGPYNFRLPPAPQKQEGRG